MREFLIAAISSVAIGAGQAAMADEAGGTSITYHVAGTTVAINRQKGVTLKRSPKTTYLDQPFAYDCLSPDGCVVSVSSIMQLSDGASKLCTYVDGHAMRGCSPASYDVITNLQGEKITQGTHTLQTGVVNASDLFRKKACPCDVTYTIYDNAN